ncbi:MAG: heavy-metal-associated domain-containing protein [Alkalibacterium sp.]|uniref:Copper chaperone CopZ n=1 Tax=Alkalibacterium gilvum TaxID=1130080 RepID=A0A1H6RVT0_9LACT|nr:MULTISPECIES: heavy-metal-associated domain-containing protein [Alkalibacterium]MDN6193464.1 heavy-metal-associated domain-containing protein [Alkalibacterium sp.]MDN6294018.1 heavy-metal-associated domain-containing protein [Alkalibacterium sp.]MDN6295446.1 heavy-metal-associated domain-containing protein [Alkalibacterium sp.]MDN6326799.1 heavy-metal-associated domain-containing protein [Alkalibacterium sp.]MDN6385565.1 heavy-metal-associated domain-containing protein [Alkalibacterium sp.]
MKKAILKLETLACPSCMQKIENALKGLKGIEKDTVKVLFNSSKAKTVFDSEKISIDAIEKAIEDLGYPVIKSTVKDA